GWITRFLSHGYNVVAHDIAEGAEEKLRKDLEAAWPGFIERGIAKEGDLERLTFEAELEAAVKDADIIQENAPEREDIKRCKLEDVDALTKETAITSASTFRYMPSTLQAICAKPERVIVSHPFNPVDLISLVVEVGGEETDQAVV